MNNLFLAFAIKLTFITGVYGQTSLETQAILQSAFTTNLLHKVFTDEILEETSTLKMYSNNHFSGVTELTYRDTPIEVEMVQNSGTSEVSVDVTEFDVKFGRKAFLEFYYDQKRVRIKLKKVDNSWSVFSTEIKGKGVRLIDVEF